MSFLAYVKCTGKWQCSRRYPFGRSYRSFALRGFCSSKKWILTPEEKRRKPLKWIPPDGYSTGITIYNTATRSKVPFKTIKPGSVTWYVCGPTVYDVAHLGHVICYMKLDIIHRIMRDFFNLNVTQVMNITDIDDKVIQKAKDLDVHFTELTQRLEKEFFHEFLQLNILTPTLIKRVTDYIPKMIAFIEQIFHRGLAYIGTDGTVYFDSQKYGFYIENMSLAEQAQVLSKDSPKKSPRDFALWKQVKPNEPSWPSPWGDGRPGWHVECSTIAVDVFGPQLDLHSGASDLIFPHHHNEALQCCAYSSSEQWCNYWLHSGILRHGGIGKMSKSLGNILHIGDVLQKWSVNTLRMYCLLSHYRSDLEFCESRLEGARGCYRVISSFLQNAYAFINNQITFTHVDDCLLLQKLAETQKQVHTELADDFQTPYALRAILSLISLCNKELKPFGNYRDQRNVETMSAIARYIHHLMDTLGVQIPRSDEAITDQPNQLAHVMTSLLNFRASVKAFALLNLPEEQNSVLSDSEKKAKLAERKPLLQASDSLRKELGEKGICIKDFKEKAIWSVTKK